MTQGMDLGIPRRAIFDADGIPAPPSWLSEMVDAKLLTLLTFDRDYTLAVDVTPGGARVVAVGSERAVAFTIGAMALAQIAPMILHELAPRAKEDLAPLPASGMDDLPSIGDFQVFQFVRTDAGAVLYTRAVDTRFAVRLTFRTVDDVVRFGLALAAAREAAKAPHLERLDIPYTTIGSKDVLETPEDLHAAVRLTKTASGRGAGLTRVGDAFGGMVPDEIFAKYDASGVPLPAEKTSYAPNAAMWVAIGAFLAGVIAVVASRAFF